MRTTRRRLERAGIALGAADRSVLEALLSAVPAWHARGAASPLQAWPIHASRGPASARLAGLRMVGSGLRRVVYRLGRSGWVVKVPRSPADAAASRAEAAFYNRATPQARRHLPLTVLLPFGLLLQERCPPSRELVRGQRRRIRWMASHLGLASDIHLTNIGWRGPRAFVFLDWEQDVRPTDEGRVQAPWRRRRA